MFWHHQLLWHDLLQQMVLFKEKCVGREFSHFTLAISNENMSNKIRITKPLKSLGVLVDGVSKKKVKHEIKK